jgi:hypothetical protein
VGNAGSATSNFSFGVVPVTLTPPKRSLNLYASLTGKPKKSAKSVKIGYQLKFSVPTSETAAGCTGSVQISTRIGKKKKKAQKPGALTLDGKTCRMRSTIKLPRSALGKRVTFDSFFPGNNVFLPSHSIKTFKIKR